MRKSPQYDTINPPGQVVNNDFKQLAYEAKSMPKAKTLGDIINKVWKSDSLSQSNRTADTIEEAFERGKKEGLVEGSAGLSAIKAEAYTQGFYDGILEEKERNHVN